MQIAAFDIPPQLIQFSCGLISEVPTAIPRVL
jgi:hypothetical protein